MPIYEYKCLECGAHLEKMLKISDPPLTVCENCGGKLEKQWSLSGFQFKGDGWYVTDYAGKKADKAETGGKSAGGEKTEKTSAAESTAAPESASNSKSDNASSPVKETAAKKD